MTLFLKYIIRSSFSSSRLHILWSLLSSHYIKVFIEINDIIGWLSWSILHSSHWAWNILWNYVWLTLFMMSFEQRLQLIQIFVQFLVVFLLINVYRCECTLNFELWRIQIHLFNFWLIWSQAFIINYQASLI